MIPIIPIDEARKRAVERPRFDDVEITEKMREEMQAIYGEPLSIAEAVSRIIADVRARGDAAVREWTQRITRTEIETWEIPKEAYKEARLAVSAEVEEALFVASRRVRDFHEKQYKQSWMDWQPAGGLGQIINPIDRIGVYVPGGAAPLVSSLIHCVIPARVAGVEDITVTTPCDRDGQVHPAILRAAEICGVSRVLRIGGAQAVAALAYGTETAPRVDKIVGPGGIFVILAKKAVFGDVDIDQLPGPTETLVVADDSADPRWIALDLMAQAEHDVLARPLLVTTSWLLAEKVQQAVRGIVAEAPRGVIMEQACLNQGWITVAESLADAIDLANRVAPEHLCLSVENAWDWVGRVRHAGGVFVGEYCMESLGDYVLGPSHCMPTNRTARFSSPLNVWDFVKITSVFGLSAEAVAPLLGPAATLADAEGLHGHAAAIRARAAKKEAVQKRKEARGEG